MTDASGTDAATLAVRIEQGDLRALARGLTGVESGTLDVEAVVAALPRPAAPAQRVGITGPPGVGKSTLVSALTTAWRQRGARVGVLAIDPSSPFTGGALLGDRIRMQAHHGDEGVYIRSMASRGEAGGLAAATYDAADLLEAAGFSPVLIETVGVGQGEVEVCRIADTTLVVLAPGSGDAVQAMKVGLLEIADVVVVNQGDREGADALVGALRASLDLRPGGAPPIVTTVATTGDGVGDLLVEIDGRLDRDEGTARRTERAAARIRDAVDRGRAARFWRDREVLLAELAASVAEGSASVAAAVRRLRAEDEEQSDA